MQQQVRTVFVPGQGRYEEKKSVFLSYVDPVSSEEEAEARLAAIRKEHYAARHHCYAYVIGADRMTVKCSDDGEPSQTAGQPILSVLKGEGLTDCMITVVRYFGGTLLGTGGLIRSYTNSAKDGILHTDFMTKSSGWMLKIRLEYTDLGKVQFYLRENGLEPQQTEYTDKVTVYLPVYDDDMEKTVSALTDLTQGHADIETERRILIGITAEKRLLFDA